MIERRIRFGRMPRVLVAGFWVVFWLGGVDPSALADEPASLPFRAYRVSVFDKPKDDPLRKDVAEGVVLFAERTVRFDEVPALLKSEYLFRYREIYFATELDPTGCYTLISHGSEHGSVGVLAPRGLVGWHRGPDNTIEGRLYQSPDSVYDVSLTETGERLEGIGNGSLGYRAGTRLVEYFEGTRLPTASLADCFREPQDLQSRKPLSAPLGQPSASGAVPD